MGTEIDLELRFAAEEQFITGQVTLEQLAQRTGISVRALERWSADEGWVEKRRQYRQSFADIKRNTVELRRRFVEKALTSLNPMDAFAISALEKLALAAGKSAGEDPGLDHRGPAAAGLPSDGSPVFNTPAEAVAVLRGIVEDKLARMLTQPESVNLAAVKDVKQALELIDRMQAQAAPPEAGDSTERLLSEQAIKDIREQLNL